MREKNLSSTHQKDYPNSNVSERAFLVKIFHNEQLQKQYLDSILPGIFLNPQRRLIIYLMRQLKEQQIPITLENILMLQNDNDEQLNSFIKKHRPKLLEEEELQDMLNPLDLDSSERFFDFAKNEILKASFARFIEDIITDVKWYNSYNRKDYHRTILGKLKAGIKIHDIIYNNIGENRDQYQETMQLINSTDEYIPTSSQVLNSFIGGFTRGYVDAIIAKSSHVKSSWVDFNILQNITSNKVSKVVKITPEEDAPTQLRRYIAMLCKLSTSQMRLKLIKVTSEHITIVKKVLKDKLEIHDNVFKYKDIIELMYTIEADMIYVDHINSIDYPGTGTYMSRMIGNIPGLIGIQKKIAKSKHCNIINLSQVGDKEIQKSDRLIKAPRYWDAYGSSVLYQASREFLALWYPYKDYEDSIGLMPTETAPTINDIQISIEKSSFSKVGKIKLYFDPEYNMFYDSERSKFQLKKLDYNAPEEPTLF